VEVKGHLFEHRAVWTAKAYSRFMAQTRKQTIPELETTLVVLQRREMRLQSVLSSPVVSPENRKDAREALEAILDETREIQDRVLKWRPVDRTPIERRSRFAEGRWGTETRAVKLFNAASRSSAFQTGLEVKCSIWVIPERPEQ